MTEEEICTFALQKIFIYEPRIARALLRECGSACAVFSLGREALSGLMGPYNKYRDAILSFDPVSSGKALSGIGNLGIRYLTYDNPAFSTPLSDCDDAPIGLFVRSDSPFDAIFPRESISVVGTRDMSSYGSDWCSLLVKALGASSMRPAIVSGLALGVDVTAHKSALEAGLPTIAVLGTGIDTIYPHSNEAVARKIISSPGCAVISEFPPGSPVQATNFLSRNRIIAGLSRATCIIESRLKGGSMSTAHLAASYGREVFALPGRNDDVRSQGCNMLIAAQIARAVTSCEDLLSALGYKGGRTGGHGKRPSCRQFYSGSMEEDKIPVAEAMLKRIREKRDISLEELAADLSVPFKDVCSLGFRLENDAFIHIDILQRCSLAN